MAATVHIPCGSGESRHDKGQSTLVLTCELTVHTFKNEIQNLPENGVIIKLPLHTEIPEKKKITSCEYLIWQFK